MRIVFIGPPGAGKGTQSDRLAAHLKIPKLSTGDMLRSAVRDHSPVGTEAARYMDQGRLVPDALVQEVLFQRLTDEDCAEGCILDGFPRTVPQAVELDRWLKEHQCPLSLVLEIRVKKDILLERLSNRGRGDDDCQVVLERLKQYDELTHPLLDYYRDHGILHTIEGNGTPDSVYDKILQVVEQVEDSGNP